MCRHAFPRWTICFALIAMFCCIGLLSSGAAIHELSPRTSSTGLWSSVLSMIGYQDRDPWRSLPFASSQPNSAQQAIVPNPSVIRLSYALSDDQNPSNGGLSSQYPPGISNPVDQQDSSPSSVANTYSSIVAELVLLVVFIGAGFAFYSDMINEKENAVPQSKAYSNDAQT